LPKRKLRFWQLLVASIFLLSILAPRAEAVVVEITFYDHSFLEGDLKLRVGTQSCLLAFRGSNRPQEGCKLDLAGGDILTSKAKSWREESRERVGTPGGSSTLPRCSSPCATPRAASARG
jgi:hypothetical protein